MQTTPLSHRGESHACVVHTHVWEVLRATVTQNNNFTGRVHWVTRMLDIYSFVLTTNSLKYYLLKGSFVELIRIMSKFEDWHLCQYGHWSITQYDASITIPPFFDLDLKREKSTPCLIHWMIKQFFFDYSRRFFCTCLQKLMVTRSC